MSEFTPRYGEPKQELWIGYDPASPSGDQTAVVSLFHFDRFEPTEEKALAAEARHTGILITIGLPAGVLITWLFDWITGGPGLGAMVGL